MDWAASEWKEGLSGLARQKVDQLEEQLARQLKVVQQKQLQSEQVEQALNCQKKKTEEVKVLNAQMQKDMQSLCDQQQELRNKNEKLQHDLQFKDNQLSSLEGQLSSSKSIQACAQTSASQFEELQLENRELRTKCAHLERAQKLPGSLDNSFADKTPSRGRQTHRSEDEIERLRIANDLLNSQVKELEQKLKNMSKEVECNRHNQEAARVAFEAKFKEKEANYQEEIRQQSQAGASLSKKLEETMAKLQQEISKSVTLDSLRAQADKDSANLQKLDKELRDQHHLVLEKDNKLIELENTITELKKVIQHSEKSQEGLQAKAESAEAKVARLEKDIKTSESDMCILRKDLEKMNTLEEKCKSLTERLSTMEHNLVDKENNYKVAKSESDNLKITVEKQLSTINDLKQSNSELGLESANKDKKLQECSANNEQLNKELEEEKRTVSSLKDQIVKNTNTIKEKDLMLSQFEARLDEIKILEQQLAQVKGNEVELTKDNTYMKELLRDEQNKLSVKLEQVKSLDETIINLRNEVCSVKEESEKKSTVIEELQNKNSSVTVMLEEANRNLSSSRVAFKNLEESSTESLAAYSTKLTDKSDELCTLKEELVAVKKSLVAKEQEFLLNEEALKQSAQSILELQQSVSNSIETREKLEQELREKEAKIAGIGDIESKLNKSNSLLRDLNNKLLTLKMSFKNLENEASRELSYMNPNLSEKIMNVYETSNELALNTNVELECQKEALEESLQYFSEMQLLLSVCLKEKFNLRQELENSKSVLQEIEKNLDARKETEICLKNQLSELELKIQEYECAITKHEAVLQERDEVRNKYELLFGEVVGLRQENTQNKQSLDLLSKQLESAEEIKNLELNDVREKFVAESAKNFEDFEIEKQKFTNDLREIREKYEQLEKASQSLQCMMDVKIQEMQNDCIARLRNIENSCVTVIQSLCDNLNNSNISDDLKSALASAIDNTEYPSLFTNFGQLIQISSSQLENIQKLSEKIEQMSQDIVALQMCKLDFASKLEAEQTKSIKVAEQLKLNEENNVAMKTDLISLKEVCANLQEILTKERDEFEFQKQALVEKNHELFNELEKQKCSFFELQEILNSRDNENSKIVENMLIQESNLKTEVAKSLDDISRLENANKVLETKLQSLEQEMLTKSEDFKSDTDNLNSLISELKSEIDISTQNENMVKEQLVQKETLLAQYMADLEMVQKQHCEEKKQILSKERDEFESQKQTLLEKNHELSNELEKQKNSFIELQEILNSRDNEKSKMVESMLIQESNFKTELAKSLDDISRLENANKVLETKLQSLKQECENFKSDTDNLNSLISELKSEIEIRTQNENMGKEQLVQKETLLAQYMEDLEMVRKQHCEENEQILSKERDEFESQKQTLLEKNHELSNELEKQNNSFIELQEILNTRDSENSKIVENMLIQESNLKTELHKSIDDISRLENANKVLETKLQCFEQEMLTKSENFKSDTDNLNELISELKSEIEIRTQNENMGKEQLVQTETLLAQYTEDLEIVRKEHCEENEKLTSKISCIEDELEKVYESNTKLLNDLQSKEDAISSLRNNLEMAEQKLVANLNLINNIHNSVAGLHSVLFPDESFSADSFNPDFFLSMLEKLRAEVMSRIATFNQMEAKIVLKDDDDNLNSMSILDSLIYRLDAVNTSLQQKTSQIQQITGEANPNSDQPILTPNQTDKSDPLTLETELATRLSQFMDFIIESLKRLPISHITPLEEIKQLQLELTNLKKEHCTLILDVDSLNKINSASEELNNKIQQIREKILHTLDKDKECDFDIEHLIDELINNFQTLKSECENKIVTIKSLEATIEEIECYLQDTFEEKQKVETELTALQKTISELSCTLQENDEILKEKSDLLVAASNETADAGNKCVKLEEKIQLLELDQTLKESQLADLQNTFDNNQKHIKDLEEKLLKLNMEKEQFQSDLENLRKCCEDMSLEMEKATKNFQNEFAQQELQITEYKANCNNLQFENNKLQAELLESERSGKIKEMKILLSTKSEECEVLALSLKQKEASLRDQSEIISATSKEASDAINKLALLQEELSSLKEELKFKDAELTNIQDKFDINVQHIKELEEKHLQLTELELQNISLKSKIDTLLEELAKLKDYEKKMSELENLKVDYNTLKLAADQLNNERSSFEKEASKLKLRNDHIKRDNENLKEEIKVLEEELKPVRSLNSTVISLIEKASSFDIKIQEIDNLEKKISEAELKAQEIEMQRIESDRKVSQYLTQNEYLKCQLQKLDEELVKSSLHTKTTEEELQKERSAKENMQVKLDSLELALKQKEQKLQLQENEFVEKIDQLTTSLSVSQERCITLENELENSREECKQKNIELQDCLSKLIILQDEASIIKRDCNNLVQQSEEVSAKLKESKCNAAEIQAKYEQAKKDIESAKGKIFMLNRNARKREELLLSLQADLKKSDNVIAALKEEVTKQENVAKSVEERVKELEKRLEEVNLKYTEKDESFDKLWKQHGLLSGKVMEYESSNKLLREELQSMKSQLDKSQYEHSMTVPTALNKLTELSKKNVKQCTSVRSPDPPALTQRLTTYASMIKTPEPPTMTSQITSTQFPAGIDDPTSKKGILTRVERLDYEIPSTSRMTRQRTRSSDLQNVDPKAPAVPDTNSKKPRYQDQIKETSSDLKSATAVEKAVMNLPTKPVTSSSLRSAHYPLRSTASTMSIKMDPFPQSLASRKPLSLSQPGSSGSVPDSKAPFRRHTRTSSKERPSDCAQQ